MNNSYGAYLLCDNTTAADFGELDADPNCEKVIIELAAALGDSRYDVAKLTQSGSDAVAYAVGEVCEGDLSRCMFAAGTYVVGDMSNLRQFSTNGVNVRDGQQPAVYRGVLPDQLGVTEECLSQIVPLPYFIPRQISEDEIILRENLSLRHLNARFALNALSNKPTRALFLELILASNGAELSKRFMEKLSEVCKSWDVHIVIDEVLTSVRCDGRILLALSWGLAGCFSHAVIGKWPGIGVVFRSTSWPQAAAAEHRGETTVAASWGAYKHVKIFNANKVKLSGLVADRRRELCESLQAKAEATLARQRGPEVTAATWGQGAMVFSNVQVQVGAWSSNQDYQLMAGRYLPRVISTSAAALTESDRVEMKPSFAQEQSGYVRDMFYQWLAQGESIRGYHQLQLISKMQVRVSVPLREWVGLDEANRIQYPGADHIFDQKCLKEFLNTAECVAYRVQTWSQESPWFISAKKTQSRHLFHFMLPPLVKYRNYIIQFPVSEAQLQLHI